MSARRLKGYVVRTSEGWYVSSAGTLRSITPNKKLRTVFPNASRAALHVAHDGDVSLPVFATPKRQTLTDIPPEVFAYSDNEGGVCLTWPLANAEKMRATEEAKGTYKCGPIVRYVPEPKPAPAEGAADARYACWQGCCMWLTPEDDDPRDTGTRAEAEAVVARIPGAKLVRVLDDGAHEAACEAAAERGRIEALTSIRDACEFKADTVHDGPAMGLRMAMVLVDNAFKRLGEEKGQAK